MLMRLATLSLAATFALVPLAFAQEEAVYADIERIHGDTDGFFELFSILQDAVMFGDPTTFAQYAIFPLAVNGSDGNYEIADEADLLDNFDDVFGADIQQAMLEQDPGDLIVTQDGVGIGNGAVWITNVCLDDSCEETQWGILSVNH